MNRPVADLACQALSAAAAAAPSRGGWLVGGAVRDLLLGTADVTDLDLIVAGDPQPVAAAVAAALGAPRFSLSDRFGGLRVTAAGGLQVDVMPLHEAGLEADLAARDVTVNALAIELGDTGSWPQVDRSAVIDPGGGLRDLEQRVLRAVGPRSMADDPVRVLRLGRAVASRSWQLDGQTVAWARAAAPALSGAAGERVGEELRMAIGGGRPLEALRTLRDVGGIDGALPELAALDGVQQSRYHHRDVGGHTREVLARVIDLEDRLSAYIDDDTAAAVSNSVSGPVAGLWSGRDVLRMAALLHDIAKPQTQIFNHDRGVYGFPGHDTMGREIAGAIMKRLKAPGRVTRLIQAMTLHHLRLGFLVHARPLGRGTIYDYLRGCEPVEVEVSVLSLADRLATRGRRAEPAIEAHAGVAREILPEAVAWREAGGPPAPLLDGNALCELLGRKPGPWLAGALEAQRRARFETPGLGEREALAAATASATDAL